MFFFHTFSLCKPNVLTACKSIPFPPLTPFFFHNFRHVRRTQHAKHINNVRSTTIIIIIVAHGGTKKIDEIKSCPNTESNSGPSLYERDALPTELLGQ